MKKLQYIFFIITMLCTTRLHATTYYLSNNGSDENTGTSMQQSWKSIARLNEENLKPGDTVLFHAGQSFIGTIRVRQSGTGDKPIVYSTHGDGARAIISGAYKIDDFQPESENVYAAKVDEIIKHLYYNNKIMTIARYPNNDVLTMEGGGKQHLLEEDKPFPDEILIGATARLRPINWVYDYRKIAKVEGNKIYFDSNMFQTTNYQGECSPGWSYYLDNKMEFLDAPGEWIFDSPASKVLMYREKPLNNEQAFFASFIDNGIILQKHVSNVVIDRLKISYYSSDGLALKGKNENIQVTNCAFQSIHRNAIICEVHGSGLVIKNNYIADVYGRGISLLESRNCEISHNILKRIGMKAAYGIDGLNGAIGISITNREGIIEDTRIGSKHNLVAHNCIDSTGYMGIRFDGAYSRCEYNSIKNVLLTLNDGAGIHCWGADSTFTHRNIIRNNVIKNVLGNTLGTPSDHTMNNGIYLDNGAHHIQVINNSVSEVGSGVHTNAGSYNNVIKGNTLFGNETGISFAQWGNGRFENECENNTCTNNLVFNTLNMHPTLRLLHTYKPEFNPGVIDSNLYASPREMYHIYYTTVENGCKHIRQYTLDAWQQASRFDAHSKFIEISSDTRYEYFVNDGASDKSFDLEDNKIYKTLQGEKVEGSLRLGPYSAKILLYDLKQ